MSKRQKPWWLHFLAIGIAIFCIFVGERYGYAWGGALGAAAGSLIFPAIIYYRKYAPGPRFWQALILLAALQVPLVFVIRPLVERMRFTLLATFAFGDCVFVALGLHWMCTRSNSE